MRIKIISLILFFLSFSYGSLALATTLEGVTSDPSGKGIRKKESIFNLNPVKEHSLVVVHPYQGFIHHDRLTVDTGSLVSVFSEKHRPIFYLGIPYVPQTGQGGLYVNPSAATAIIMNDAGEHRIPYISDTVTIAGGDLDACEQRAIDSLIYVYFLKAKGPFNIHVPLPTSYSIIEGDPRGVGTLSPVSEIQQRLAKSPNAVTAINKLFPEEIDLIPFLKYIKATYSRDPNLKHAFLEAAFNKSYADDIRPVGPLSGDSTAIGFPRASVKLEVFLDGQPKFTEGNGTQVVRLKLWSSMASYYNAVLGSLPSLSEENEKNFLQPAG